MYVAAESWSTPDEGDPPPCFRQGDVVRLTWARPILQIRDAGATLRVDGLEVRTENVALLGACCDLVSRTPPKRKGVLVSPLREVPKQMARSDKLMAQLRATAPEAVEKRIEIPANLFLYEVLPGRLEQPAVVYFEAISAVGWDVLKAATKVAELTDAARSELQERLKHHFTRKEAPAEA
jgi:hypothetical protein